MEKLDDTCIELLQDPVIIHIDMEHQIYLARRKAKNMAKDTGFNNILTSYFVTSVSELAGNLFYHRAVNGIITLRAIQFGNKKVGLEVVSRDDGPGIANVKQAMEDGFSTIGGMGSGLPGVYRLMDEFYIDSAKGKGTYIAARKWQIMLRKDKSK